RWDEVAETWKVPSIRQSLSLSSHSAAHASSQLWMKGGRMPVPVANQLRTYLWCSPPRIGRQRIGPALSTVRDRGESLFKDRCVRLIIVIHIRQQDMAKMPLAECLFFRGEAQVHRPILPTDQ